MVFRMTTGQSSALGLKSRSDDDQTELCLGESLRPPELQPPEIYQKSLCPLYEALPGYNSNFGYKN
eukprot:scaffold9348_cov82-Cyclotella_meneghiniana.AAC.2